MGGFLRRHSGSDIALNVLNNDDRVVDNDTHRKH
jgi:hypothetical protein